MRIALAVLVLLVLAPAVPRDAAGADRRVPPARDRRVLVLGDEPGVYVQAPGGGYVFVPLDANGMPVLPAPEATPTPPPPGTPGVPAAPRVPAAPGAPAAPAAPGVPRSPAAPPPPPPPGAIAEAIGYLKTQVEPAAARVYVDGQFVGASAQFGADRGAIALAPGRRRVDLVLPGFRPFRTVLDIEPRQTYTLVWRLTRE